MEIRRSGEAAGFPVPDALFAVCVRWANQDPMPRIIIDEQLLIRWLNAPAAALLEQNRDLYEQDGVLHFEAQVAEDRMMAAVKVATRDLSHICIPSDEGSHVLIRLRRIEDHGDQALLGLTINRCQIEKNVELADLKSAFGLTTAEQGIVYSLHEGLVAEKIAVSLGLSIDTVRSHIRSAYQKLDVDSRETLFRKLMPYRI